MKDNEINYIQAALTLNNDDAIAREFGNLLDIKDNYPKFVISTDTQYRNTVDGVEHINLRKFLVNGI